MGKARAVHSRLWPLGALLLAAAAGLASPAWAACTTPGQVPCGADYCVWNRQTCCDSVGHPEKYCPSGRACSTDGASCLGNALACVGVNEVGVISSCGTDACTCQAPCTISSSCSTGCCAPTANGSGTSYCAPSCVCQGQGALIAFCGSTPIQQDAGAHDAKVDSGSEEPAAPGGDPFGPGCGKDKKSKDASPVGPVPLVVVAGLACLRRRPRR